MGLRSMSKSGWFLLIEASFILMGPVLSFCQSPEQSINSEVQAGLVRALESISASRMQADVTRLSQPEFNGRQTGTVDDRRTALLVATLFHSLGLQPIGTEPLGPGNELWAQAMPVNPIRIQASHLEVFLASGNISPMPGTDYLPVLDSPTINVTAPIIFVGYGISDPSNGLDEYEGLDVRDRIILFLRGQPEGYSASVTLADKVRIAREKGAVAFLMFTGPVRSAYETRRGFSGDPLASYTMGEAKDLLLPGFWITTQLAEQLFAAEGHELRGTQEQLNKTLKPVSWVTNVRVLLSIKSSSEPGTLINVLALLSSRTIEARGTPEEVIVIGAHRDHFGRQAGLLFPGADDNASGTAVMLEAARVLAGVASKIRRAIMFISFSGEEQKLLGSRLYVARPALGLGLTKTMVNVDHVGIGDGRLTVGVSGLSKPSASEVGRLAGIGDKVDVFGYFPGGDHVPFKEAGVPTVTIVSSGPHPNFHRPSDQAETVNSEILTAAAKYVVTLLWQLAVNP